MLAGQEDEAVPPRAEREASPLSHENNAPSNCYTPESSSPAASQERSSECDAAMAAKDAEKQAVSPGMVRLVFLPLSGSKQSFEFDPSWRVSQVKEKLLTDWPKEWTVQKPPSTRHVDLILAGHMLKENDPLMDYKILAGQERIVHLVIRPDYVKPENNRETGVCRRCKYCCIIL